MRRIIMLVLLIVAVPIAGLRGADWAARLEFATFVPGLVAARVTADAWRRVATIDGLTFHRAGLNLRVGRVTFPFAAPLSFVGSAYAQDSAMPGAAGGTVSADNIDLAVDGVHYTIKNITLTGTSLTKTDLESIFDPQNALSIVDRIGKVSAAQIAVPEIDLEMTLAGQPAKTSYHDINLTNVAQGRVANASIGSVTSTVASPNLGAVQSTYGPIKIGGLDLALAARIATQARSDDAEPRKILYESVAIGSGKIAAEKSQFEIDMGALAAKDVKARPLRVAPLSAAKIFAAQDQDSRKQAAAFLGDMLDSFEIGAFDLADLRFKFSDADTAGSVTLGGIHLSQMVDSKIAGLGFENLVVQSAGATIKVGGFTADGIDFTHLRDLARTGGGEPTVNRAIPSAREMTFVNTDVDITDKPKSDTHFQLAKIDLLGADPVNGIPSHFSTVVDHFTMDLKNAGLDQLNNFIALGYDKLDLSSRFEAHFDAAKRQLALDDLSLSGSDMGTIKLAGNFENVGEDLFSADQAQIEAAALSILIRRVEIRIENAGLFDRLIAAAAKKNNKSPDEIRQAYVAAAAISIPALLGDSAGARAIGSAVAKFIAAPKTLHIVAVAPQGLGAADFVLIKDPDTLMQKLSIEATANDGSDVAP